MLRLDLTAAISLAQAFASKSAWQPNQPEATFVTPHCFGGQPYLCALRSNNIGQSRRGLVLSARLTTPSAVVNPLALKCISFWEQLLKSGKSVRW